MCASTEQDRGEIAAVAPGIKSVPLYYHRAYYKSSTRYLTHVADRSAG